MKSRPVELQTDEAESDLPPEESSGRKQRRPLGWFLAFWTPMVLLFWVLLLIQLNGQISALETLAAAVRLAFAPGLGGIVIWYVSGKIPWPEKRYTGFVVLHLLMGGSFALLSAGWFTLPLMQGVRGLETSTVLRSVVPWQIASNLFLYGLMAGISYAVRGSWLTRDQRLAKESEERLRVQAELASLRAHINPHFLFNTLHSVNQLLRADTARAETAVERLSELFRYALRLDREHVEVVTLEDEWRFCSSYLWLEQMRMGDRLRVDASFSDEALACLVPPFTLQPLIENAIRHGLSTKVGAGTLIIRAIESNEQLLIEVSDDGVGAFTTSIEMSSGIGLRAVRQRLYERHGRWATVLVDSLPGRGTTIRLVLPAEASA